MGVVTCNPDIIHLYQPILCVGGGGGGRLCVHNWCVESKFLILKEFSLDKSL